MSQLYSREEFDNFTERIINYGYLPIDILVTGATGTGKSTTIRGLVGDKNIKISDGGTPQTTQITSYNLGQIFRIWDSPGLGDSTTNDLALESTLNHLQFIKKMINDSFPLLNNNQTNIIEAQTIQTNSDQMTKADAVVLIINGSNRDLGTPFNTLEMLLKMGYREEIIIGINFIDQYLHANAWDYDNNKPLPCLEGHIPEVEASILKRIYENSGVSIKNYISFSAIHGYNLTGILKAIINTLNNSPLFDWL